MKQTHKYLVKKLFWRELNKHLKPALSRMHTDVAGTECSLLWSGQGHGSTWAPGKPGLEALGAAWGRGPRTFRTTGLPSLMSWASIMATLWSMVVEWSVLSAELPTNVPRAKTAAQRTCRWDRGQSPSGRLFGSSRGPWSRPDAAQSRPRSSWPSSTRVDEQEQGNKR